MFKQYAVRGVKYLPANSDGEGSVRPFATFDYGHFAADVATRAVEDFVRVAMFLGVEAAVVGVGYSVVRVAGHGDGV